MTARILPQDMHLVWSNCMQYNKGRNPDYFQLGERYMETFKQLWATSDLSTGVEHPLRSTTAVCAAGTSTSLL